MRLDLALFGLRLFKSRSQATDAIQRGQVLLNGRPVKPSHEVRPGDRITLIAPGKGIEPETRSRTLEILDLPGRSVSREAARALIREVSPEA